MAISMKKLISCLLATVLVLGIIVPGLPRAAATQVQPRYSNVAAGKSVAFFGTEVITGDGNYGLDAVKAGLSVLTDGTNDSPNWWVNNGNPYIALKSSVIQGPYLISVDLGAEYETEQISLYCYSRTDWNIQPLDAVTFTVSNDGNTWTTLGTVTRENALVNTVIDTRNGNAPVDIYEFALPATATGRYVRANFDTNSTGMVGIGEFEVYGQLASRIITKGANITYFGYGTQVGSDANWGADAVNAGLSVLTDGVGNSPNWWVNNGNPNIGLKAAVLPGPYVFNLDIGSASSVDRISTYFYSRTDWGVDAPDAVTYSYSTDGTVWKELGTVTKAEATQTGLTDDRNPDAQIPTIYTFTLRFQDVDARYLKVTFDTNSQGLIGLQEILAYGVKKTVTNLALNKMASASNYTYQVTGGGTGYESTGTTKPDGTRYTVTEVENTSASRLTDGVIINASKVSYPSSWSSQAWNSTGTIMSKYLQIYRNDSRIITLDLGAVRNVTGIRMHFAALESMGFYMPTNVTYYLSQDGETYYEVKDVWNYQTTADGNDANISGTTLRHEWYAASGINYNARYVKLSFPVNVYILSDELQVYGCETLSTGADDLTACPQYDPLEKYVGHFADAAQTGGVRNEFMAYSGWYINSDGGEVYNTYKTVKEYMTSIAYIDEQGVPQDWLFDDVTVMGHYYTARGTFNSYKAGYTEGKYYANQSDWYQWLCYAFGKDANGNDLSYDGNSLINLEALEEAARSAKQTLNDPDYKVGVKLVLFPAVEYQESWGTIDGEAIDFTIDGCGSQEKALENRAKAYRWYIDQAVSMWENAGFEHLELTGFYYYEETIHESTDRIAKAATQALTDIVHTHVTPTTNTKPAFDSRVGGRLYIYQLPFYQSEGYWNWAEYGFDYALMQPNYSFYDMYTLTQLKECAELCTYYGLGMQMEFGGTASTAYHEKFEDYLTYGKEYGYQSAVVSWYMSTWGCYSMAYGSNGTRYLYDMVYDFVKGQTIPTCQHESHNLLGRCTNCAQEVGHTFADGVCIVCGAAEPEDVPPVVQPTLTLKFPTLTFEDVITMNVFFEAANLDDVAEMGLITYKSEVSEWNVDNAEAVIPGYRWDESQGFYCANTAGIPAKDMGDTYWFAVYAKLTDGSYAYTRLVSYSPAQYAYGQLSDPEMSRLVVAMLNYGAAAQTYFNYRTDSLMNAGLTEAQQASVETYRADMMNGISSVTAEKAANFTRTATGFVNRYPTITFDGAFCIDYYAIPDATVSGDITLYYWDQTAFDACDALTAENATGALTMVGNDGTYKTSVAGIAAKDLDKGIYVAFVYSDGENTYCSGILGYSIGVYCVGLATGTDTMAPFAQATAVYGYYAKEMFY